MKIVILGTGGVGGYFGGRLAAANRDVTFVARGLHLSALQRDGLFVHSIAGDFHLPAIKVTDDTRGIGHADIILVGVKSWQLSEAAEQVKPLLGPNSCVIPLLNGVQAARRLAAILGPRHVANGTCRIMSYIESPGRIRHAGVSPVLMFGEVDNQRSKRLDDFLAIVRAAGGCRASIPADINIEVWRKFLLVSPTSCIGALARVPMGSWREIPESRAMWQASMLEIMQVAQGCGVGITVDDVEQLTGFVDGLPRYMTASMQRDIMEGKPSELESQCGELIRLAAQLDVPVPVYHTMYANLRPQEMIARGEIVLPKLPEAK